MTGKPTRSLTDTEWEAHRSAVFGAAYRILGTVIEAEDVTQEVWLRTATADPVRRAGSAGVAGDVSARTSYNVLKSA